LNQVIRVENVSTAINGKVLLDSINIHLEESNRVAIFGEAGSGKTLIYKILSTVLHPSSGKVLFFDKDIFHYPRLKERIGYISQEYVHYSYFTVKGLLSFYNSFYKKANTHIRDAYLDFFKIRLNDSITILNKRQQLGLTIIAALMHEPRIVIIDHFSHGLDETTRLNLLKLIKDDIGKLHASLLLLTPDIIELEELVTSVAMLIEGKIAFLKGFSDYRLKYKKVKIFADKELDFEDISITNIKKVEREGKIYSLVIDGNLNYITELLSLEGFQILDVKDYTLREFLTDKKEGKIL